MTTTKEFQVGDKVTFANQECFTSDEAWRPHEIQELARDGFVRDDVLQVVKASGSYYHDVINTRTGNRYYNLPIGQLTHVDPKSEWKTAYRWCPEGGTEGDDGWTGLCEVRPNKEYGNGGGGLPGLYDVRRNGVKQEGLFKSRFLLEGDEFIFGPDVDFEAFDDELHPTMKDPSFVGTIEEFDGDDVVINVNSRTQYLCGEPILHPSAAVVDTTGLEEDVEEEEPTESLRFNEGKPQVSQILDFPKAIAKVSEVMSYGAQKYSQNNWKLGGKPDQEYLDSCMRHLLAFKSGEVNDPESECRHVAHAVWNLLVLLELNDEE